VSRDRKVQLGARVPAEVRALAFQAAAAAGQSMNQWLEQIIVAAVERHPAPAEVLPGQLDIAAAAEPELVDRVAAAADETLEVPGEDTMVAHGQPLLDIPVVVSDDVEPGTAELRDGDETRATIIMSPRFAKNCRNETLHWRCGVGNPCKFCGGER
jgi:hypothetical protein